MKRTHVIYIVSEIDKSLAFEWIADRLSNEKTVVSFILLNPGLSALEVFLKNSGISVKRIRLGSKTSWFSAFLLLFFYLAKNRSAIVHCHMRIAEILGIAAAFLAMVKKRIFTRHSGTYHHLYHRKGVWIDRGISMLATDIVAVSQNVRNILIDKENVPPSKVHLIPHGFDLNVLQNTRESDALRIYRKYNIPPDRKVVGIIARYTLLKGFAYSIPAAGKFLKQHPDYFLLLANTQGNQRSEIKALIAEHLDPGDYVEVKFEPDLPALYAAMSIHIHVPFDATVEAFGQTYVEALACGVPSIFTLSGVAPEFIRHEYNALVVDFKNSGQIENALLRLSSDPELCQRLKRNGRESVKRFDLSLQLQKLEELYFGNQRIDTFNGSSQA